MTCLPAVSNASLWLLCAVLLLSCAAEYYEDTAEFLRSQCNPHNVPPSILATAREQLRSHLGRITENNVLNSPGNKVLLGGAGNRKLMAHRVDPGIDDRLMQALYDTTRHVHLPPMIISINARDEPGCSDPQCLAMSFCKNSKHSDILLPVAYAVGPGVPSDMSAGIACCSSVFGSTDWHEKISKLVWRGSQNGGYAKGRRCLSAQSKQYPNLIDAGMHRSSDGKKPKFPKTGMSMERQLNQFKYIAQVDGQCASIRFPSLLASDSAVMKIDSDEIEWYYPLVSSSVHHLPNPMRMFCAHAAMI